MVQMQAATLPALAAALPSFEELREQVVLAALERTCLIEPLPRDRPAFVARKEEARGRITLIAQEVARLVAAIVQEAVIATAASGRRAGVSGGRRGYRAAARRDYSRRISSPARQPAVLQHYPRYLKAIFVRLDKIKNGPGARCRAHGRCVCIAGAPPA
jgi:ATP-dependent helicase HrpA